MHRSNIALSTLAAALLLLAACTSPPPSPEVASKAPEPAVEEPAVAPDTAEESTAGAVPEPVAAPTSVAEPKPAPKVEAVPEPAPQPEPAPSPQVAQPEPAAEPTKPALPLEAVEPAPAVKPKPPSPVAQGKLSGSVMIKGKNGEALDSGDVIINLEPTGSAVSHASGVQTHAINMRNKFYDPPAMVVNVGDSVEFANSDGIKHNVFSSSGDNTFDLGTYGLGQKRSVSFDHPGIVKVYCNIHPEMATFISVGESGLSTITDAVGNFVIEGIPAGEYRVSAWHVRGEAVAIVSVAGGATAELQLDINSANYQETPHLNKFGEPYKQRPALFDDEEY